MEQESDRKKELIRKLRNKYRLLIINDSTFEERWSYLLTPLNVFTGVGITFLVFAIFLYCIIAFTPIRELIHGYPDTDIRINSAHAAALADSLEKITDRRQAYIDNIQRILKNEYPDDSLLLAITATEEPPARTQPVTDSRGRKADSILRAANKTRQDEIVVEFRKDQPENKPLSEIYLLAPLKGTVTSTYSAKEEHFGVDIVAPENAPIKATLSGTVIFANWTPDNGYVLQIQHGHNFVSVYKHNSVLLKKVGDFVSTGDAVAIIGNSGELSDGPHLHFEIWENGKPLDPMAYLSF